MDKRYFPLFHQALARIKSLCAAGLSRGMEKDNFGFSARRVDNLQVVPELSTGLSVASFLISP
ncbi:MAG: hypothetical protein HYX47_05745 [Burkholderiales bacterium]|nr:hypothetical protein [Burkholderiales bacterium]